MHRQVELQLIKLLERAYIEEDVPILRERGRLKGNEIRRLKKGEVRS